MNPADRVLLDTSVVMHLIRGNEVGQRMDREFQLASRADRPLLCVVSVGEALVLARIWGWPNDKIARLRELMAHLVIVDVRSEPVLGAYADIAHFAKTGGLGIGDNDCWIGAAAAATDSLLITNDRDFDPLESHLLRRVYVDPAPARS